MLSATYCAPVSHAGSGSMLAPLKRSPSGSARRAWSVRPLHCWAATLLGCDIALQCRWQCQGRQLGWPLLHGRSSLCVVSRWIIATPSPGSLLSRKTARLLPLAVGATRPSISFRSLLRAARARRTAHDRSTERRMAAVWLRASGAESGFARFARPTRVLKLACWVLGTPRAPRAAHPTESPSSSSSVSSLIE
eukprot:3286853-Prymnesium_polylepis.2